MNSSVSISDIKFFLRHEVTEGDFIRRVVNFWNGCFYQWANPYRSFLSHDITGGDFIRKINLSEWFIRGCANPWFLTDLVVSDEAAFALNEKVITWNLRVYAPIGKPPRFNYDVRSSCQKINLFGEVMW